MEFPINLNLMELFEVSQRNFWYIVAIVWLQNFREHYAYRSNQERYETSFCGVSVDKEKL